MLGRGIQWEAEAIAYSANVPEIRCDSNCMSNSMNKSVSNCVNCFVNMSVNRCVIEIGTGCELKYQ